jgi:diaminopimelate decarboxylase
MVYRATLHVVRDIAQSAMDSGFELEELCVGGGWAVPYRPGDPELTPEDVADALRTWLPGSLRIAVEPGRALVARAGVAVYRVLSVKHGAGGTIIAVDGGMGDNPRPALYGAEYTALRAIDPLRTATGVARIVGRYCEEGDVLVDSARLSAVPGDLVVVPVSGAYQLSMASGYNLVPMPAVVMVSDGAARLVTRRATLRDLLARELQER